MVRYQRSVVGESIDRRFNTLGADIPSGSEESNDVKSTSSAPASVEYMGTVDVNSIEQLSEVSTSSGDNTNVVPYLSPLGEEEYKKLKEKARSGELTPNTDVTTPPNAANGLETLQHKDVSTREESQNPSNTPFLLASPGTQSVDQSDEYMTQDFSLQAGFNGLSQNGWVPSDVNLAVGPNYVMQAVNPLFGIYSKSGTLVIPAFTPQTFFNRPGDVMSDPHIVTNLCSLESCHYQRSYRLQVILPSDSHQTAH